MQPLQFLPAPCRHAVPPVPPVQPSTSRPIHTPTPPRLHPAPVERGVSSHSSSILDQLPPLPLSASDVGHQLCRQSSSCHLCGSRPHPGGGKGSFWCSLFRGGVDFEGVCI
ncbi:hypothetical protein K438DRAFT_99086 [Mycena galopus ATCC 62051]|nr:hypothetical protein K438DRAFT_99086 [Mycena galopus ATCC 62051]